MTQNPAELYRSWMELRAAEKGLHALEMSKRLDLAEAQLLASACGNAGEVSAIRLEASWPSFLGRLPALGHVKTVTRNPHAVIEVEGTYDNIEFFGSMGQSVSSVDLRIFTSRWLVAFAVREETRRGTSRGLQFFDKQGNAVHKLFLREKSDVTAYETLVREHTSADQTTVQAIDPPAEVAPARADAEIDLAGMREAWLAMTDTHEFHALLAKYRVARTQALRLIGEDLAQPVAPSTLTKLLESASRTELPIMTFIGNRGMLQIHTGVIKRVAPMGPWINVLDPGFDVHIRTDRIDRAWVVRKPTADGNVTSLELYDAAGDQIAQFFGKRKPGTPENEEWRALLASAVSAP